MGVYPSGDTAGRSLHDHACHAVSLGRGKLLPWTEQDRHYFDNTGGLCDQYHIRAWEINHDSMIGSAHEEDLNFKLPWDSIDIQHISSSGPDYTEYDIFTYGGLYHSLKGFDSAEDEVAGGFSGSCWSTAQDSHYLGNQYTRKTVKNDIVENTAYNDGYATVISCS